MKWLVNCLVVLLSLFFILVVAYLGYLAPTYELDEATFATSCVTDDIQHCGCCGQCSNKHDYEVYVAKNDTLTEEARSCAVRNLFGDSDDCFEQEINFTVGCAYCWAENVRCTRRNCWFPCLMETMLGLSANTDRKLSKCFSCDEFHCLDGFITCAGMSRRRAGVVTDIQRDSTELCNVSMVEEKNNCSHYK